MPRNRKSGKAVVVVLATIGVIALVVVLLGLGSSTQTVVPANSQETASPLPGRPVEGTFKEARKIMIKGENGETIEIDPNDKASIDAALAKLPEERRQMMREMLDGETEVREFVGADGKKRRVVTRKGGPAPEHNPLADKQEAIEADAKATADMMRQLIDQGVPPEKAREIANKALADSIMKNLNDPNLKVETMVDTTEEGAQRTMIMIGKEEEHEAPQTK